MAKKKPKRDDREREPEVPKFAGFHPLAAGLGDLKSKLDAEQKKNEADAAAKAKAGAGKGPKPPPPRPAAPAAAAAPPRASASTHAESDADDEHAFHRMMSGVTPLAPKAHRVTAAAARDPSERSPAKPADLRVRAERDAKEALERLHHLVDDGVRFEVTDDGKRVEGRRLDAAPNLVRQLRHGGLPIDARLDLHGSTAGEARERLTEFLRTMRTRGERCVLVIHGKGDERPSGGVLRGEMAAWLSQGRAREHVVAFATAREEDGGEGAVYVALRR
jgi:DNA-nicking Smr family endonuclease